MLSPAASIPVSTTLLVDVAIGRTRFPVVSSKTEQTGRLGQGDANVIVHRPPLVDAPTLTRPAPSLPPIEGDVPQSLDPEPTVGVAPVTIWCPSMPSAAALRGVIEAIRKLLPSNCNAKNS